MRNTLIHRYARERIRLTGIFGRYQIVHDVDGESLTLDIHKADIGHAIVRALRDRYIKRAEAEKDKRHAAIIADIKKED